ncbi:IclR family transcriptional regulator [Kiloniella majae]|uniref:IclR family transcriptional regulator n=1 Tax=Kiloniella majae TaxID=1938558 RepID=UPI000A278BB0|nr:IclR family transcriptional regulator [Kiloniella majae]
MAEGTVGKALVVLDLVSHQERPVRFNDLLEISPYPKATLYRLLQTLTVQGMLSFDSDNQTYSLGMRLVRLAHNAWRQSSLAPIARPYLDELSKEIKETIHLAQLDRGNVLYVDKRNAAIPVEMFSQAGKTGPGYCTGVGKAMMAFLAEDILDDAIKRQAFAKHTANTILTDADLRAELMSIREAGISYDREEHEPGIICIAAPILSASGRPMGAISITTTTAKHALAELDAYKRPLLNTVENIARDAENWQFPG